ncbi:plasminogen-like isoform X1 [Branchiostoma floridae x Branchiostoma japonicum]
MGSRLVTVTVMGVKGRIFLWLCIILTTVSFIAGQSPTGGQSKTKQTTKAYVYAFVGRSQFPSAAYWDQNALQTTTDPPVKGQYKTGCGVKPGGSDYRGNISVTTSGKTCQRWDVDFPHDRYYRPEDYPELVENYCRNPHGLEPGLWCYTTHPSTRSEYCVDPACPFVIVEKWRGDGRCGEDFPTPEGTPGECNPNNNRPCCSLFGWCGEGSEYCFCLSCVDYRAKKNAGL